ncbi:TPA: hypothetical protein R2K53_001017 [Raoultella ornithinolytica]|nr:hypothetical protein [Raoultella ornithinolytica]
MKQLLIFRLLEVNVTLVQEVNVTLVQEGKPRATVPVSHSDISGKKCVIFVIANLA